MAIALSKPITRQVAIRFLGYPVKDYMVEIRSDGIRLRKKGTRTWYGPAGWESILNAAARVSARDLETQRQVQRAHA
jgi:hypothetical protein